MERKQDYRYEQVSRVDEEAATFKYIENGDDGKVDIKISSTSIPSNRTFLYIAACTGNLAAFTCGTVMGWTSPEIPKLKTPDDSPLDHVLTTSEEGWIGSFLLLAAAIGPFAAGVMSDKIGRKKTLLIGAVPFLISFAINLWATNVLHFFVSRFICGLGVGVSFTVIPMYIGEIADDETRGILGSFLQLFVVIGILFSYVLGPFTSIQFFNAILMVPPSLFIILFLIFIPDSPFYHIKENNADAAEHALSKLRGKPRSEVQNELKLMTSQVDADSQNKSSFFDIFKSRALTKALLLTVSLVAFQQLSGVNYILFYAQDIFADAGVTLSPEICPIIIGLVQLFASGLTSVLLKKFGKRYLLLVSGAGTCISQSALAFFFYLKDDKLYDVSTFSWIPIASLMVYIVSYSLGLGPIPWAVMGELFPGNIKSVASTVTTSGCWILGFLITNYFGVIGILIGKSGSFGFFAGCCLCSVLFVYELLPETSGKSFKEIQDILNA